MWFTAVYQIIPKWWSVILYRTYKTCVDNINRPYSIFMHTGNPPNESETVYGKQTGSAYVSHVNALNH